MNINSDLGCFRAMDPDMALGSSPGIDYTMALGDSTGLSDSHDPGSGMVLEHQHGHWLQPRPLASMWPLVAIWAMGINTDCGCGRIMGPRHSSWQQSRLGRHHGPRLLAKVTQINMSPVAVWPSVTNMAAGGSPDP